MRSNRLKNFIKKGVSFLSAVATLISVSATTARSLDPSWFEYYEGYEIQTTCIWGDANYNNILGSDDASKVLGTYSKNATGTYGAGYDGREDVNFDGMVNSVDASLILEQYAKTSIGGIEKLQDMGGVFIELPFGRTFSGIAVEESMSIAELQKLNPDLKDINNLSVGQKIYVLRRPSFFEEEEETTTTDVTKKTTTKSTTSVSTTVTAKPTTTTSMTKKITTTTITTVAIVTDTPVNTKPVTVFEKDHTYKLAPGFLSWTLYSDVSGSNVYGTLFENQLIKVSEEGTMCKGVLEDGTNVYFTVYPQNFHQWVEVETTTSTATTATTTAIEVNSSTTIEKMYVNYELDWKIRSEQVILADNSNVVASIKAPDSYFVLQIQNGWEYVEYEGVYGWMYTAEYSDNFVVVNSTTTTTTTKQSTIATTTTKQSTTKSTTIQPTTSTTIKKVFVGDEYNPFWRIRSAPTTSSKELCKIYAGQEYQYFSIENGWEKVMFNGVHGYIGTSDFEYLFSVYDPNNPINTTPVVTPSEGAFPESVLSVIRSVQSQYPNAKISASAYDLSGRRGYTYNGYTPLYAGCSLKAAYATFVLKQCEARGIDISKYCLEYREGMKNTGAGDLQYSEYGTMFTVGYLIDKLIIISDNTAYNILLSEFPMWEYKQWLNAIGGQQNIAAPYQLYGSASSRERVNEWVHVWNYISSGTTYANRLRYNLSVASPNFLGSNVYHKSGSCDQWDYTCASDAGVVNGTYILAIVVQDAESEDGSANAVRSIANAIRSWVASNGIF